MTFRTLPIKKPVRPTFHLRARTPTDEPQKTQQLLPVELGKNIFLTGCFALIHLPALIIDVNEDGADDGGDSGADHDRNSIRFHALSLHQAADNGGLRSQGTHASGHSTHITDDGNHDGIDASGNGQWDSNDRDDGQTGNGAGADGTEYHTDKEHSHRDGVDRNTVDDLLCHKFQCAIAVDDSKEVGHAHHLDEQRGRKTGDNGLRGNGIALEKNGDDHCKADGEDADIRLASKAQNDSEYQRQQGNQSYIHFYVLFSLRTRCTQGCRCAGCSGWESGFRSHCRNQIPR